VAVQSSGARLETPNGSHANTKRFFDLSVDMLCIAGTDGYFKHVNRSWSRILGYSAEELMSIPYLDFVHPDDRDLTIAEATKLALGFETVHFRNRYRCKDGSYRWLAWTAGGAQGDVIYAGARDISLEMEAQEEELMETLQRLQRINAMLSGRNCSMRFQPIVDFRNGDVIGMEALARFKAPPRQPPDHWFAEADAVGLLPELEMAAIEAAIPNVAAVPRGQFLSVNVSPETLLTKDFSHIIENIDGTRLVVEVTEHAAVHDYKQLNMAIAQLRQHGIRLAIDDAGAGFSSLKHIIRLVPDFIKLDMFLTRDIHVDPVKRALATAMVGFASDIGSRLIAEGVETARELDALGDIGFQQAQGFFLGRPGRSIIQAN
jgi:PAS domain S-box-containing protein